jgi:GTPase SAR1 family protein
LRRFFDWLLLPGSVDCVHCSTPSDYRLCPRCHAHLPDSVVELPSAQLAIFGPQSVGKTTYVSVMLHEIDHRVGPERHFVLDPLTDEVRDRYDREYHSLTYGGSLFGVGEELEGEADRRSHSATPSIETNRAILQPLVYRLTHEGGRKRSGTLLSIYDTAGEDWEMNIELLRHEARYLRRSRGLLFLIDPLRIRQVAHDRRIQLTEKERRVPPADYLGDIRKLASFFRKTPISTPLAICLNKLDRWGGLLEPGSTLHTLATSVPDPSAVDDERIHAEVEAALRSWGAGGFLEHARLHFPDHRFFACSALGDAAPAGEDAAQPLPTPILVERPVLRLLERQGVLRNEGGRSSGRR